MTMTNILGCKQSVHDQKCKKPGFSASFRRILVVFLTACTLMIIIVSYITSFKHGQSVREFYDIKHFVSIESASDEHILAVGYTPKGALGTTGSVPKSLTPVSKPPNTSDDKLNCFGVNTTSELLRMEHFHFLPKYKNPCWYEPLVKGDVYVGNKFEKRQKMFKKLSMEWSKRLEEHQDPKRLRCLPYFFIAGQPKCGTTDLYKKVTSHPDVVAPPVKEPHWWTKKRVGGGRARSHAVKSFQHYLDLFDEAALSIERNKDTNSPEEQEGYHQLVTGDASASTLWWNDRWSQFGENCGNKEPKYTTADYIKHLLPHSKIIVILRNPTERLYSDYLYFKNNKKSLDDFHQNVVSAINSLQECINSSTMRSCIYNRTIANYSRVRLRIGIYYVFLQDWLRVFPRQKLLVFRLEDYAKNRMDTLKTVFEFLGLRPLTSEEEERIVDKSQVVNARGKENRKLGDMRKKTRRLLDNFYRPYNKELSILLHDHKYLWM